MEKILEIKNLSVSYNTEFALRNVNVTLNAGEIISVIGPNGSGKSTLLKAILNLIDFQGEVIFKGYSNKYLRNQISYMPQSENVDINFPITVRDVIEQSQFGREFNSVAVDHAIKINHLGTLIDNNINELSGGQLQRVFLARAIAQNGDLFLLDEPFSNMDITSQNKVIEMLIEFKKSGKTIVITTHNLRLAEEISDRVMLINKKLVAFGKPDTIFHKANIIETFGENVIFANSENITLADHHEHKH